MGANSTIINQPSTQTNNSEVTITAEPSLDDDNSIVEAVQAELGLDDDATVDNGKEENKDNENDEKKEDEDNKEENPEDKTNDDEELEDDGKEVEIPEKFKTKDGNLNLKAISKYIKDSETNFTQLSQKNSELEKKQSELQEKATLAEALQKQQDELAKQFGFTDFNAMQKRQQELQVNTQIASFEANSYAEYLALCEDPQGTRDLLIKYAQNPTPELAQLIDEAFPVDVHKKVATAVAGFKNQLASYNQEQEKARNIKEAEEHIENVVKNYADWFKNKEFTNFYGLAFQYIGTDLDPQKLFPAMLALKNSWIEEYKAEIAAKKENQEAINQLQQLNPNSQTKNKPTNVDLNNISQSELDKLVGEYI